MENWMDLSKGICNRQMKWKSLETQRLNSTTPPPPILARICKLCYWQTPSIATVNIQKPFKCHYKVLSEFHGALSHKLKQHGTHETM